MNPILDPNEVKHITIEPEFPPDGPYYAKRTSDVAREQIRRMKEGGR